MALVRVTVGTWHSKGTWGFKPKSHSETQPTHSTSTNKAALPTGPAPLPPPLLAGWDLRGGGQTGQAEGICGCPRNGLWSHAHVWPCRGPAARIRAPATKLAEGSAGEAQKHSQAPLSRTAVSHPRSASHQMCGDVATCRA